MFMVAAFCGLRLGELLDLRWGAVNFSSSSMHVESSHVLNVPDTPKSGVGARCRCRPMSLALSPSTQKRGAVGSEAELVFTGREGSHVDANALRKRYYAAVERAQLRRIRIDDLRHIFGTVCAAKGVALTNHQGVLSRIRRRLSRTSRLIAEDPLVAAPRRSPRARSPGGRSRARRPS